MRQEGRSDRLPPPGGAYSQSIRSGGIVHTAGQGGFDPETGHLVGDDVAAQTQQALANVEAALEASGASLDDVVRVGVFLADLADFAAMNETYRRCFREPLPARTTVGVDLPAGMKVEIDAMAVLDR
jgi:2-iminobutanoate/2-iminopropanoate deaminase